MSRREGEGVTLLIPMYGGGGLMGVWVHAFLHLIWCDGSGQLKYHPYLQCGTSSTIIPRTYCAWTVAAQQK